MYSIPFPVSSMPGVHPSLGRGRLVNALYQPQSGGDRWRRVPGLRRFTALDFTPVRAMAWTGHDLLVIAGTKACRVDSFGAVTVLSGDLYGSAPVSIARNNNATPDIVVVGETSVMRVGAAALTPYPDGNVGAPRSVASLDGYLLFTSSDGVIRASDLNSATINGLSFARAESNPDGLLRGLVSAQLFYAFGNASVEVFQDVGASPFPLERVAVMPLGLYGRWALAGGQSEGWSSRPLFVANDGTVREINGYQQEVVSIDDVTRDILAVPDPEDIVAQVYSFGEAAIWSLTAPGWTWEFNCTTRAWHQRRSNGRSNWRGLFATYAFGRWLVAERDTGVLFAVDGTALTEAGLPLVFEVESDAVKSFPARGRCRRADFDFAVGFGRETGLDPVETAPTVMIAWSDDGGASWSVPLARPLGREGRFRTVVSVLNAGLATAHGRKWRLTVSDPVECALLGGVMAETVGVT